jgi:predicted O-methyltransferase YrrM
MTTPAESIVGFFGGKGVEIPDGYRWEEVGGFAGKKWHYSDAFSCEIECGDFLWGLTRYLIPDVIVETGTFYGFAAGCMALACKENERGHVYTIEIDPDLHKRSMNNIANADLSEWVTVLCGDSTSIMMDEALHGRKIDIALIDGGDRRTEYNKYAEMLSPIGVILLHDVMKTQDATIFMREKGGQFIMGCRGLGINAPR